MTKPTRDDGAGVLRRCRCVHRTCGAPGSRPGALWRSVCRYVWVGCERQAQYVGSLSTDGGRQGEVTLVVQHPEQSRRITAEA